MASLGLTKTNIYIYIYIYILDVSFRTSQTLERALSSVRRVCGEGGSFHIYIYICIFIVVCIPGNGCQPYLTGLSGRILDSKVWCHTQRGRRHRKVSVGHSGAAEAHIHLVRRLKKKSHVLVEERECPERAPTHIGTKPISGT